MSIGLLIWAAVTVHRNAKLSSLSRSLIEETSERSLDASPLKCSLHRKGAFGFATTLTFDLWPLKPFQRWPLTRWICISSFTKMFRYEDIASCEIRSAGQTKNISLVSPVISLKKITKHYILPIYPAWPKTNEWRQGCGLCFETVFVNVSVSAIYVSCPEPIFGQIVQVT